jgi:hypothetical protein
VPEAAEEGIIGMTGIELSIWADQQEDLGITVALLRAQLEALAHSSLHADAPKYDAFLNVDGTGRGDNGGMYGDGGHSVISHEGSNGYDYSYSGLSGSGYSHGSDGLDSGNGTGDGEEGFTNGNGGSGTGYNTRRAARD